MSSIHPSAEVDHPSRKRRRSSPTAEAPHGTPIQNIKMMTVEKSVQSLDTAIERLLMPNFQEHPEVEVHIAELRSFKDKYQALWTKYEQIEKELQLARFRTQSNDNVDDLAEAEKEALYIAQVKSSMTEKSLIGTISATNIELNKQRANVTYYAHELERVKNIVNKDFHLKKDLSQKIKDLERQQQEENKASKNEIRLQKQKMTDLITVTEGLERQVALFKKNNQNQASTIKEAAEWKNQAKRTVQLLESEKAELSELLKSKESALQSANRNSGNLKLKIKQLEISAANAERFGNAKVQEIQVALRKNDELELYITVAKQEFSRDVEGLRSSLTDAQSSHEVTMEELQSFKQRNEELQLAIDQIQYKKNEQAQELDSLRKENIDLLDHRNREYQELRQNYANLKSTIEILKFAGMETFKVHLAFVILTIVSYSQSFQNEKETEGCKRKQLVTENVCNHERDWEMFCKQNERIMESSRVIIMAKDHELECRTSELNTYKAALIDMEVNAGRTLESLQHHNQELQSLVVVQDVKAQQVDTLTDQIEKKALELEDLRREKINLAHSFSSKCQEVEDLRNEFRSSMQTIKDVNDAELEVRITFKLSLAMLTVSQKINLQLSILNKDKQDACVLVKEKDQIMKNMRDTFVDKEKELFRLHKEQEELKCALDAARQELGKLQYSACKDAEEMAKKSEALEREDGYLKTETGHIKVTNDAQTQTVHENDDPKAKSNNSWTTEEGVDLLCTTLHTQLSFADEMTENRAVLSEERALVCPLIPEPSTHQRLQKQGKETMPATALLTNAHTPENHESQSNADLSEKGRTGKPRTTHVDAMKSDKAGTRLRATRKVHKLVEAGKAYKAAEDTVKDTHSEQEQVRGSGSPNVVVVDLCTELAMAHAENADLKTKLQAVEEDRKGKEKELQSMQEKVLTSDESLKNMIEECKSLEIDKNKMKILLAEKHTQLLDEQDQTSQLTVQLKDFHDSHQCTLHIKELELEGLRVANQAQYQELEHLKDDMAKNAEDLAKIFQHEQERAQQLQAPQLKEPTQDVDTVIARAETVNLQKQIRILEKARGSQEKYLQAVRNRLLSSDESLKRISEDRKSLSIVIKSMKAHVAEKDTQLRNEQAQTSRLTLQLNDLLEQYTCQKCELATMEQRLEDLRTTHQAQYMESGSYKNVKTNAEDIIAQNDHLMNAQAGSTDLAMQSESLHKQTDSQQSKLKSTLENPQITNQAQLRKLKSSKDEKIDAQSIKEGTSQLSIAQARVEVEALRAELDDLHTDQQKRVSKLQEHRQQADYYRIAFERVKQDNKSLEVRRIAEEKKLNAALNSNQVLENQVLQLQARLRAQFQEDGLRFGVYILFSTISEQSLNTLASNPADCIGAESPLNPAIQSDSNTPTTLDVESWRGLKKSLSNANEGDNREYRLFKNPRASVYSQTKPSNKLAEPTKQSKKVN
ncbi:uncharacterized protein C8R40DRAFT_1071969 [Lentinula edodes]|uniref:uncharacterized protein n=1 Tax=Lentinula edodes TaxID=5353 RepID=UPI001E8D32C7|nr:uncharacterized protein C8R40DRAFT_1071969 [Lentinula edodes]KAH7872196.1 hypothetical protein C8R40DRAFT_1071969 [Lentinula edodes]